MWDFPVEELEEIEDEITIEAPVYFDNYCDKLGHHNLGLFYGGHEVNYYQDAPMTVTYDEALQDYATSTDEAIADDILDNMNPVLLELVQKFFDPTLDQGRCQQFRRTLIKTLEGAIPTEPSNGREVFLQPRGEHFALNGWDGRTLVLGTFFEILEYVQVNHPGEIGYLLNESAKYGNKILKSKLDVMLRDCRAIRRLSPIIDKITKSNQLPFCESDCDYYRYDDLDYQDDPRPRIVVNDRSSVGLRFDVDRHMTKQQFLEQPIVDAIYFVNTVKGDSMGANSNDKDLLDKITAHLGDATFQVHIYIYEKYKFPNAYLVHKARPHNLTATVEFDVDGPDFGVVRGDLFVKSIAANKERNSRFFKRDVKDYHDSVNPYLLTYVAGRRGFRAASIVNPAPVNKYTARQYDMERLGGNAKFDFSDKEPHVVFSQWNPISEILHLNDAGYMSPEVSFRSLGLCAKMHGSQLYFQSGVWRINIKPKS